MVYIVWCVSYDSLFSLQNTGAKGKEIQFLLQFPSNLALYNGLNCKRSRATSIFIFVIKSYSFAFFKHSKVGSGEKTQITWDNPKELEAYIQKLQTAAERLSTENRKLRKWHTSFIEKVSFNNEMEIMFCTT